LSGLSKTIPVAKFDISNGFLTSISYDAKDSTSDIIKSGVSLVTDAASTVLPGKLPISAIASLLLPGNRSLSQDRLIRSFQISKSTQEGKAGKGVCNEATKGALDERNILLSHLSKIKANLYDAEIKLTERKEGIPGAHRISKTSSRR
jgi:hypothetical protein